MTWFAFKNIFFFLHWFISNLCASHFYFVLLISNLCASHFYFVLNVFFLFVSLQMHDWNYYVGTLNFKIVFAFLLTIFWEKIINALNLLSSFYLSPLHILLYKVSKCYLLLVHLLKFFKLKFTFLFVTEHPRYVKQLLVKWMAVELN
jgi:hypothetical protein